MDGCKSEKPSLDQAQQELATPRSLSKACPDYFLTSQSGKRPAQDLMTESKIKNSSNDLEKRKHNRHFVHVFLFHI